MVNKYSPEQGDIILLDFDPQTGHEQKGRRPAYVASNKDFHNLTNLAIVCPITSNIKGFPLHVPLDEETETSGVIMCEQVKSLDLKARRASYVEKAPRHIADEVFDILYGSIEKIVRNN
jgi:mRNA interferase MazF